MVVEDRGASCTGHLTKPIKKVALLEMLAMDANPQPASLPSYTPSWR